MPALWLIPLMFLALARISVAADRDEYWQSTALGRLMTLFAVDAFFGLAAVSMLIVARFA